MREVVDLIVAFVILLSGVALAPVVGMLAVRTGEIIGMHPASMLMLAIFGFFCVVLVGLEVSTRRGAA